MENPDRRAAISRLTGILRKITRIVQIVPFVYLVLYILMLLTERFLPENILCIEDMLFAISPMATVGMLGLSRLLRLCAWHKVACLLPTSTHAVNYIDTQLFQFTQYEIITINITLSILSAAFLVAAYIHFFYGRQKASV